MAQSPPGVVVLGGPNGAGKSTAAPRLLRGSLRVQEFVNADTLAQGLSAFRPEDVAIEAGRVNFFTIYRPLADAWRLYDATPVGGQTLVATGGTGLQTRIRRQQTWRMAAEGFEP